MNSNRSWIVLVAGAAVLTAGCAADSPESATRSAATAIDSYGPRHDADSGAAGRGGGHGHSSSHAGEHGDDAAADTPSSLVELTQDEIAGLLWMREEEQLAHDVYVALGEHWGLRIFDNIAASEATHVERVVGLLDRYGIDDPMADQPAGTFTIPELQQWHDELVADGSESIVRALEVGALIEETDIVDLRDRATDVGDIDAAYDLLEQGSHKHLRAFTRQLGARDTTYEPTVLDATAYDEIVSG